MPEMLELSDVCDVLHLSKSTVRRLWEKGDFPVPLKIGRKLLWRKQTIDMHIAKLEAAND